MPTYNTPGVYVEEISTLPASVASVATAIPGFVGLTEIDPGAAVRLTSMLEFEANFGGPVVGLEFDASTGTISASGATNGGSLFYYCMQHYFANGGGPCYVVSLGDYAANTTVTAANALNLLAKEDEVTLLVAPQEGAATHQLMLTQCANLQDRFAVLDMQGSDATAYRTAVGNNNLKYGAAYYPNLITSLSYPDSAIRIDTSGVSGFPISVTIDSASVSIGSTPTLSDLKLYEQTAVPAEREAIAALLNEISIALTSARTAQQIVLPPSAAIAGIYASVDRTRGVWKAPANVSVSAVLGPLVAITSEEQGNLNVDASTGKSINVIRSFTGKGTLVWGARTLAGNDNEWRYVPVRRLFITAEESIKKASEFVVFEPNDANTWIKVKVMIENYLTGLWKDGALAGATAQEAFFVNVGLGSTMTAQDILEGKLIIEIGMAAVRPAEFIILRFQHKLQES